MNKYDLLWKYVQNKNVKELVLTFEQINNISKNKIDHSFLKYKKEIENLGYKVKISLKNKTVTFNKIDK